MVEKSTGLWSAVWFTLDRAKRNLPNSGMTTGISTLFF